jgi:hypothetical protein
MAQLKAFVRIDRTGRVVPGTLLLRYKKPGVGNWMEIDATECCSTPSSERVAYLSGVGDCCPGGQGRCLPVTIYLLQSCIDNPQIGCQVWADQAGTIPVPNASYFIDSGVGPLDITTLANGGTESFVISITPC